MITLETISDDQVIYNFLPKCGGRSFYVSKDGIPGLAPLATKPGDIVTILLGLDSPMILRPTDEGDYKVVGEAYYDGFMDGEALLGPFTDSFAPVSRLNPNDRLWVWQYLNQETGLFQVEDPRLGSLPAGWSLVNHDREDFYQRFVNDATGKKTWDDPRLTSEALRKRGVPLQVFELV